MKNAIAMACAGVAPARLYSGEAGGHVAPAGVVHVASTYALPGPGWVWKYHATYGGGHHPQHGWQ